jgi:short-subunit dehydrogenase
VIAEALGRKGARLMLAARSSLEASVQRVAATGAEVRAVQVDLVDDHDQDRLLGETEQQLGPVDVLVNNAGVESIGRFPEIPLDEIDRLVETNLVVPMRLTRKVLPGMIARGRGHVVNVASLAGLSVMAYNESYSASKFGLVGFTRALRASLQEDRSPVSASAICPGFVVDAGMFSDQQQHFGVAAPPLIGSTTPEKVAAAVVRAIERDLPEVIVNPGPMRALLALGFLFPSLSEWLAPRIGANVVGATVARTGGIRPR